MLDLYFIVLVEAQDLKALLDLKVIQAHKEIPVRKVLQGLQDVKALLDLKVIQAHKEILVLKVPLELLVLKALLESEEQLVEMGVYRFI